MSIARKRLQKIGNSTGVVLPAELLREAGLKPGDEVILPAERGRLVISVIDPYFDQLVAAADRFVHDHPMPFVGRLAELVDQPIRGCR